MDTSENEEANLYAKGLVTNYGEGGGGLQNGRGAREV